MPSRRDSIRMTEAEMWDYIAERKNAHLATINRDGSPHLTTLWFALVDGDIVLETFRKSQKVKNLERDARLSLMFESGTEYQQLRGVVIHARAELHNEVATVHRLHKEVLRRNSPEIGEELIEQASAGMAPKKTAIVVRPEKIISWDHSKLDVSY